MFFNATLFHNVLILVIYIHAHIFRFIIIIFKIILFVFFLFYKVSLLCNLIVICCEVAIYEIILYWDSTSFRRNIW